MKREDLQARFTPGMEPPQPPPREVEVADELVTTFADMAGATEEETRAALQLMARALGKFRVSMNADGSVTFAPDVPSDPVFIGVDIASEPGSKGAFVIISKGGDGTMTLHDSGIIDASSLAKMAQTIDAGGMLVLPPGVAARLEPPPEECKWCEPLRLRGADTCKCGKKLARYNDATTGEPIPTPGTRALLPRSVVRDREKARGGVPASDKTLSELGVTGKRGLWKGVL